MKPLRLVFHVYQGQTFNDFIEIDNADGTPADLTGYSARLQAREDIVDPDPPLVEWTTGNGKLVITPLDGRIAFSVTAAETSAIANPNREILIWQYSLEVVLGAYVERLVEGRIVIHPELTREP